MKYLTRISLLLITILLASCKQFYTVTTSVQPAEGGSIIMSPFAESIQEGTSVTFTATPNAEYVFTGWSGSLSGTSNPETITVSSDINIIANFILKEYPLTLTVEGEGSISEKIISTKTDYTSGTVVELAANPAKGWQFDHWEGDLQGSSNPEKITISSAKTVKAAFIKNQYQYKLTIIGPGVVNEELVDTKNFEYNTSIALEAVANEFDGAVFAGWEGDVSGTDSKITVRMDSDKTIIARFLSKKEYRNTRAYPLPDLSKPSYELKQVYVDEDFSQFTFSGYQMLQVDYNRDGYLDVITALYQGIGGINDSDRIPIGFYLGNPDGTFTKDEKNDGRIQGMLHIRKMVYGDLNKDGFPDFVLIAHGYDAEPFPGEYPVILMSSPSGAYSDIRFTNIPLGFYHGGATGDIDNDGDLDVFIIDNYGHSGFLINDGSGNLTYNQELVDLSVFFSLFNAELYDIDKDGYLDLICGGHDWEDQTFWDYGDTSYSNTPIIFWGNGKTYKDVETTRLPETAIEGYGLICDFLFFDLDKDGTEELILARTGDGVRGGVSFYAGWAIQVLKREGRKYVDVTTNYLSLSNTLYSTNQWGSEWLVKINIEESANDGSLYLCGVFDTPLRIYTEKLFEYKDNNLFPLFNNEHEDKLFVFGGGCIYFDEFWGSNYYSVLSGINISYDQQAYQGNKCIYWKASEAWKQDLHYVAPKLDLSKCVKDYEIEFYVKYTNPNLILCTNLETKDFSRAYGHSYPLPKEGANGEWHRVHAPLSDFYHCDNCDDSGWKAIQGFHMWVTSENTVGAEFFLDEIRIRKILPE